MIELWSLSLFIVYFAHTVVLMCSQSLSFLRHSLCSCRRYLTSYYLPVRMREKDVSMVKLNANQTEALVDDVIHLTVEELHANQKITVVAALIDEVGDKYQSYAHYTADLKGLVDLSVDVSESGSYTGVSAMGLFCTLLPSSSNKHPFSRLMIRNVDQPLEFKIFVLEGHIGLQDFNLKSALASIILKRWYKAVGVKRVPVREGRIRGTLFIPKGAGPFPAVVDIFGSAGGLMEFRSALLASRGFLSLSLAFFSYDDLSDSLLDLDMEYFEEAKNFLLAHTAALKGGVGIIGVSTGGTLALMAASYIPEYTCCVSINGPVFTYFTALSYKGRHWIAINPDMSRAYIQDNGMVLKNTLEAYFNINKNSDSIIEFHKSNSSFLFIFSEDDMAIDAINHKNMAERILHDSKCDYQIRVYEGAGHLLEPPYSPHAAVTFAKILGMPQTWGGNSHDHALAQLNAWSDLLQFLRDKLPSKLSKL